MTTQTQHSTYLRIVLGTDRLKIGIF